MKISMGSRPRRRAAVAAGLVGMLVIAITVGPSKPARAGAPASIHAVAASGPSVTPGFARAETDILDLQLD